MMTMTTAIALFGTRISPRFDCAQEFLLITTSSGSVTARHTETIKEGTAIMKVRRLADLKVDTVICGGIDDTSRRHLQAYGISTLANRRGGVDDVVTHYLTGLIPAPHHSWLSVKATRNLHGNTARLQRLSLPILAW